MSLEIIPRNFLSFPSFSMPSFWDDDDFTLTAPSQTGLSIYEDGNKVYVEAAVPGIDPKNVEVTVQNDYLWIRAEEKSEKKDDSKKYYKKATSMFSYRIAVPGNVDTNIEPVASCKNGVMTVEFTKSVKAQPKKIQVKVSE